MKLTFLGTGTSTGVPELLCGCEVCRSTDPRDRRLRCSSFLQVDGLNVMIDCSPDFRLQAERAKIDRIDAVLVTHEHYDHTSGLDDLRPYTSLQEIGVYVDSRVEQVLRVRLPYCFQEVPNRGVPLLRLNCIEPNVPFFVKGVQIEAIQVLHGRMPIVGYKIGRIAYLTDVSSLPADQLRYLSDLDILIVNALRVEPHVTHQSIDEALGLVELLKPKRAYFIHMSHQAGLHAQIEDRLPVGVHFAFDGLTLEIE